MFDKLLFTDYEDQLLCWVLTIVNESIFHKALNLFEFDCEITLESVSGTNQY